MNKSETIEALSKSLVQANKEVKNPKKNANNPHFKNDYATLDSVIESYKEAYLNNGISVLENPVSSDGMVGVEITLLHNSGQFITHDPFLLPPGKNTAQGFGSSITYGRRYALSAVMNIAADDDDDGNAASDQNNQRPQRRQQDPITQEQVGTIKTKAMNFASMRNADINDVYGALQVNDLTQLSKTKADKVIDHLDKWIDKAKEGGRQ